ncbi:MAG: nucleoside triphosphate pyrophosphohydrolase [Pseudomonadales bacterium]
MQEIEKLREIVASLRDPKTGCPWDIEQDFRSIAPHTIEEAYEVADAIERGDLDGLRLELGDLLLQVVFHSQMAEEQSLFNFQDVAQGISDKLVHRHPHVFAQTEVNTAEEVLNNWENIKAGERIDKQQLGLLDDVPRNLPALLRAQKLQKRAARVGLDWRETEHVLGTLLEEVEELCEVLATERDDEARIAEEMGDVFFSCVNLARHLKLEAEDVLRASNNKFENRVRTMESSASASGVALSDLSDEQLDELWSESKRSLAVS